MMYGKPQYDPVEMYSEKAYTSYSDGTDRGSQSGTLCLKYLLFVCNFIFLVVGLCVLGGTMFILIEKTFVSEVLGNYLLTVAAWLILVAAGVTVCISFFGCCGASRENKVLLGVYAGILIVMLATFLTAGILCFVMRGQIGEWVVQSMEVTLKDYYGVDLDITYNQMVTQAWDKGQKDMYCCGVRDQSWQVYRTSYWYTEQPGIEGAGKTFVPESCCKLDQHKYFISKEKCQTYDVGPPGRQSGSINEAIFYRGCYTAGKDWVWFYSSWLLGMAFGVGIMLIFGVMCSLCLLSRLGGCGSGAYYN